MIVDFLVSVFLGVLNAILSLIPEFEVFDPPGEDGTGYVAWEWTLRIGNILNLWDLFFPVSIMFLCLFAVLGTRAFVAVAHLLVFVWDKLPFKSS